MNSDDIQFLTIKELCVKFRISYDTATEMLKQGLLTGIRLPKKGGKGDWRVVDPGAQFEDYLQSLHERLLHVPLLSTREVAEVVGTHFIYILDRVKQGKIKPEARYGKKRELRFTVAEVRRFMWETHRLARPRRCEVKIEQLIRWAKQRLEPLRAAPAPEKDEMEALVDQILRLPEPARSQSLQALFRKLDKVQLIVQAATKQPQKESPAQTLEHDDHQTSEQATKDSALR